MVTTNTRRRSTRAVLASLAIALPLALATSLLPTATRAAGFPPSLGKPCGSVSGARWTYKGKSGDRYNAFGSSATACAAAIKSLPRLTRQRPRAGAVGAQTLTGPRGFNCAATGLVAGMRPAAAAGFCGNKAGAHFLWAPKAN